MIKTIRRAERVVAAQTCFLPRSKPHAPQKGPQRWNAVAKIKA